MIGFVWGTTAALAGGIADSILMRIVDGLLALPRLLIAIIVLVALRLDASTVPGLVFALAVPADAHRPPRPRTHARAQDPRLREGLAALGGLGPSRPPSPAAELDGILLVALLLELPTVVLAEAFRPRARPAAADGDLGQHRATAGPPDGCGT